MAGGATFAHGLMLKNKWPALLGVALRASLMLRRQCCAATFDGIPFVRIVAIAATHLAFNNRVMIRKSELTTLVEVTLETSFRRFSRIDNRVCRAATLIVNAARSMTGFTADVFRVNAFRFQARVRRSLEIACDFHVTFLTTF